jgi:hypothetical protein
LATSSFFIVQIPWAKDDKEYPLKGRRAKGAFRGPLEILNDGDKVLYKSTEAFKGWER